MTKTNKHFRPTKSKIAAKINTVVEVPSDFPELVRAVHIIAVVVLQVEVPENSHSKMDGE